MSKPASKPIPLLPNHTEPADLASSALEPCRVEFKQGQIIPGLGGGVRRFANGMFNPATLVAEVELQPGKVTLVSVHCALITVERPRPEKPSAEE
jgi:hypothetical protein